jgi:hypothetical protein
LAIWRVVAEAVSRLRRPISALRLSFVAAVLGLLLIPGDRAYASFASVPLQILLDEADLIVVGEITEVADAGFEIDDRPHEVAILQVTGVLKNITRKQNVEQLRIAQPGAGGIAVSTGIRFRPGQQGIWILDGDEERDVFWAKHPVQFQENGARDEVERLLRMRGQLPGGEAVGGLVARAEWVVHRPSTSHGSAPTETRYEVRFSLKNIGDEPISVCAYLGNRPLVVAWAGPGEQLDASRSRSQHYSPSRLSRVGKLSEKDFVTIPPGGVRFFGPHSRYSGIWFTRPHASDDAAESNLLQTGKHRIVVGYVNREDGRRFGLQKVWTGEVSANPLVFDAD